MVRSSSSTAPFPNPSVEIVTPEINKEIAVLMKASGYIKKDWHKVFKSYNSMLKSMISKRNIDKSKLKLQLQSMTSKLSKERHLAIIMMAGWAPNKKPQKKIDCINIMVAHKIFLPSWAQLNTFQSAERLWIAEVAARKEQKDKGEDEGEGGGDDTEDKSESDEDGEDWGADVPYTGRCPEIPLEAEFASPLPKNKRHRTSEDDAEVGEAAKRVKKIFSGLQASEQEAMKEYIAKASRCAHTHYISPYRSIFPLTY
jgi:hypothetical protein